MSKEERKELCIVAQRMEPYFEDKTKFMELYQECMCNLECGLNNGCTLLAEIQCLEDEKLFNDCKEEVVDWLCGQ